MYDKITGDLIPEQKRPTQEQILKRIEVTNRKIQEWTKRPLPSAPTMLKSTKRPIMCYYGGRFYDQGEVVAALTQHFSAKSMQELFERAYADLHGDEVLKSSRVRTFVAKMAEDHKNGSRIPAFFIEVHTSVQNRLSVAAK